MSSFCGVAGVSGWSLGGSVVAGVLLTVAPDFLLNLAKKLISFNNTRQIPGKDRQLMLCTVGRFSLDFRPL